MQAICSRCCCSSSHGDSNSSSQQATPLRAAYRCSRSSSRTRPCRGLKLWLLVALLACCSVAANACAHHAGTAAGSANKCAAPAPLTTHTSAAAAAADTVEQEPISIHYEEISEADLVAAVAAEAARRRQLLSTDARPSSKASKASTTAAAAAAAADWEYDSADADSDSVIPSEEASMREVRRCGAREVSPEERSEVSLHLEHHKARQAVRQRARLSSMSTAAALPVQRTSLNIPLYFHVITGKKKNSTVDAPQELLLKQLQAMNDAYGRYSIKFDLKGITRVQSESWAIAEINSAEETLMKAKLRKGGLGDLNIYVIRPASGTLGWSTFPWEAIKLGESFDGVLVHVGTMPGGNMKPYNKGYTMVHEVGHWLGLLHVFENGCDTPGDSVDDTPPQASAAYGCPLTRRSCPGSPTADPVTNMMGYTDDSCMVGFTRGQADRVLAMWDIYRAQNAQQKVVAEKSLGSGGATQQGPAIKQQGPKQQQQQQQPGVALLEQGHMPESIQFNPSAPPVDPAAAFASKQGAGAPSTSVSFTLDRKATSKQQRSTPAGPSKPRWGSLLPGGSLVAFNAPGAVLEANAQIRKAQDEIQQQLQQQQQKPKHKHKQHKGGWGSWLQIKTAPVPDNKSAGTVNAAAASILPASVGYQHLLPELGQYAAAPMHAVAAAAAPALQPWGTQQQQQQQQQQFQYQYAQQQPVYSQPQQHQILPSGYMGNLPLGPQYLVGGMRSGADAAVDTEAALLAAMGGVQAYPTVAVYDGAGAGGFSVATATSAGSGEVPLSEKHGRKGSKRRGKGSRG